MPQTSQFVREVPGTQQGSAPGQRDGVMPAVDVMYLIAVMRVRARFIALVTGACLAGMFIYLQFATPVYSAFSQVILNAREERVAPVEQVVSNLNISSSVIAGEVVTIRSNVLIGAVVDRLDLVNAPGYDPRLPRPEGLIAFAKRIIRGGEPPHVVASRLPEEIIRSWVINAVRRDLDVSQIGVSYAIRIGFQSPDPALAAQVANTVADQYIQSQLASKLEATLRANAWLSERLLELSAQVEAADAEVVAFRAGMIEDAGGSEESITQLLAELNTKLVASSTERADAEVRLSLVTRLEQEGGLLAVADVVTSPLFETLQQRRTELASRQAELASTLGPRHPDMVRIRAQIEDIDHSVLAELRRRVAAMHSDASVTRNREEALRQQIAVISERDNILSRASVRLSQLERTAEATRLVYENFLSRFKETSAQADFQTSEARVIGRADTPVVPSHPRKTLFMLAAAAFGLSLAIALVFLHNLIQAPVTTAEELRSLTKRRTLALLPYIRHFGNNYRWLRNDLKAGQSSRYMEGVRAIRTMVFGKSRDTRPGVIMVTSSVPHEGKTSLCCALASVLSGPKTQVLLLDADLRQSDIRSALELPRAGACLTGYLERTGKITDLVQRSELLGADVISPSRTTSQAADLISSTQFSGLITRMSARYDTVIINAPPVLDLSDALLLAKAADATLFTVRSGSTPARAVRRSVERLEETGTTVAGTVMTMVRRKDAAAQEAQMYSFDY